MKIEDNEIDNVDKLKCLKETKIKKLNLLGNPFVNSNKDYKKELFSAIDTLLSVDDKNKEGEDVDSTEYEEDEDYKEEKEEEDEEDEEDEDLEEEEGLENEEENKKIEKEEKEEKEDGDKDTNKKVKQ